MQTAKAAVSDDETVKQVLSRIEEGETREIVAATMGYQNHKSLDQLMRRRHYTWDSIQGQYVPNRDHPDYRKDPERYEDPESRARQVVDYLRHGSMRLKDVARLMRFADFRELGNFMSTHGYVWNAEINNYSRPRDPQTLVPVAVPGAMPRSSGSDGPSPQATVAPVGAQRPTFLSRSSVEHYLPLLQLLDENQSRLAAILDGERVRDEQQVPRYTLRGDRSISSFFMVKGLHNMVKDFASERKVKQGDVVEAALVEFLQSHGYSEELKRLLVTQ